MENALEIYLVVFWGMLIVGLIAYLIVVSLILAFFRGVHILNEKEEHRAFSLKNHTQSSQAWLDKNRDWLD